MSIESHYLRNELYNKMKENQKIFDFLQDGSLDGIWYWDLENPENEWMSPIFWRTLGYDPRRKKHLASEWQDLIHPEDLRVALENFKRHCADPEHPYDQIVRYLHKDGSTVWVRCRGIAVRDKTGKPVRLLGAHNDLTSLRKVEERLEKAHIELDALVEKRTAELRKTTAQLNTLMNATTDTVVLIDLEGNVVAANAATAKRFGMSLDLFPGTCAYDLMPPSLARSRKAIVKYVAETRKPYHFEDERGGLPLTAWSTLFLTIEER